MRPRILFVAVCAPLAAVALSGQHAPSVQEIVPPVIEAKVGRDLFVSKGCFECHGYSGQGADTGPKLAPGVLPIETFSRIVRVPPNQMPPYSPNILSDQELAEIHHYLSSVPVPRTVDEIPLLKAQSKR